MRVSSDSAVCTYGASAEGASAMRTHCWFVLHLAFGKFIKSSNFGGGELLRYGARQPAEKSLWTLALLSPGSMCLRW